MNCVSILGEYAGNDLCRWVQVMT